MIQSAYQFAPTAKHVAGVDEAGRGPLAGPVVASAVILPKKYKLLGLNDSKQLTAPQREELFVQIQEQAVAFGIAQASPREIDTHNILGATKLAMMRALKKFDPSPDFILTDAVSLNIREVPQLALVKGDSRVDCIAAASILAKVHRDGLMQKLAKKHPVYGFHHHFGYPTKAHYAALKKHGPCSAHRQSFRLG